MLIPVLAFSTRARGLAAERDQIAAKSKAGARARVLPTRGLGLNYWWSGNRTPAAATRPQEHAMSGIHHVTAISGKACRNVDFYTRTLGLRLVKKTVNSDDPGTYHLYYGDEQGRPGTILPFFPWEHAAAGRNGVGQAEETAFRIPTESIGWWMQRLIE